MMRVILEVDKGAEYKDVENALRKFLAVHGSKFRNAAIETHKFIWPPRG